MMTTFDMTSLPWRVLAKAFKDDLARRVDRDLAVRTTLETLDLRPKHRCGRSQGEASLIEAPPAKGNSSSSLSGVVAVPPGSQDIPVPNPHHGSPHRLQRQVDVPLPASNAVASSAAPAPSRSSPTPLPAAEVPAVDLGQLSCAHVPHAKGTGTAGGVPAAAAAFAAHVMSRIDTAAAPGPSPDSVLSPVSPPCSRHSSLSESGPRLISRSGEEGLTPVYSSGLSDPNDAVAVTQSSDGAASAGASMQGASGSSKVSPRGEPMAQQAEVQGQVSRSGKGGVSGSEPLSRPGVAVAAAAISAESSAGAVSTSSVFQSRARPQRRPATLRLRCIVRDPQTSSMLTTARGHVDDVDLPLCRPRGRALPAAADAEGLVSYQQPGHLFFVEEQVLGRGAFGFVTLVIDAVTERTYALKRMRRAAVSPKHVMQEQQALRLLMRSQLPGASSQQEQQEEGRCNRCGGARGPQEELSTEGAPLKGASWGSNSQVTTSPAVGGGQQGAGGAGRCAAAAAAAASGQPPRPCHCRFCTSAAAAVRGARTNQIGSGATAAATAATAAAAMMGPARTAWLAKQQARGWLGLAQQKQQQRMIVPQHTSTQRQRPQPQEPSPPQRPLLYQCCCRQLRGPSFCVRQLGTFQDEQYLYLLMEHCPGGDLDRLIRTLSRKTLVPRSSWLAQVLAGPAVAWRGLAEAAARFYAAGILLALQELHSHFIVYRDLKPGNVLIDGGGYPRLADFGMAKVLDGPTGRATSACGTLDYMAPEIVKLECEQLAREGKGKGLENWVDSGMLRRAAAGGGAVAGGRGAEVAGHREEAGRGRWRRQDNGQGSYGLGVDWWSYGAVLYVLLTGCKPFSHPEAEAAGEDPTRVLVRIINPWFEVPLPVYLSPHAKDLLRRLLVRQPKWRLGCGGRGAEEVKEHPFFAGFDWEAYEQRKMSPPFPVQEVSLPHDQEAESVACFFGFYGSSVPGVAAKPATGLQRQLQQEEDQHQTEGQKVHVVCRQPPPQPASDNWLQDF